MDNLFSKFRRNEPPSSSGVRVNSGSQNADYEGGTFLQNVRSRLSNLRRNNAEDLLHPYENKHASGLCSRNLAATQTIIFTRAVHLSFHPIDKNASCSYGRFTYVNEKLWSSLNLEFSVSSSHTHTHTQSVRFNHLTPNDHFSGRTAPLTSRCCIFYLFNKYTY